MKKSILIAAAAMIMCACSATEVSVTVENTLGLDRSTELVEIPVAGLSAIALGLDDTYVVTNAAGEEIPSQRTSDDLLIFQSGLDANQTATFTIKAGVPQPYTTKTYGRLVTERYDDFAWENDRVAFRLYGPALVAIDGPSNGIDAWYKRTNELIVDKWYKADLAGEASYHNDNGEGLDNYDVKRTLGAGAMAPYAGDRLWLNENFVSQEILDNGPLRTTFRLTYKDLDVDGKSIAERRTVSLDAGSQLSKVVQDYTIQEPMRVAAGIVKRDGEDSVVYGDRYIVYGQPESKVAGRVFLSVLFPEPIEHVVDTYTVENAKTGKQDTWSHTLALTTMRPGEPVTYYTGYGWSRFGFAAISDFQAYVENFSAELENPFIIKYNE